MVEENVKRECEEFWLPNAGFTEVTWDFLEIARFMVDLLEVSDESSSSGGVALDGDKED